MVQTFGAPSKMDVLLYSLAENLPVKKIDSPCFAVGNNRRVTGALQKVISPHHRQKAALLSVTGARHL